MPEVRYEATPIMKLYICDSCKEGEMEAIMCFPSNPPLWKHKCAKCGAVATLTKAYPTVEWEIKPKNSSVTESFNKASDEEPTCTVCFTPTLNNIDGKSVCSPGCASKLGLI